MDEHGAEFQIWEVRVWMQGHGHKRLDLMTLTRSISELTTPYVEKGDLAPLKNALESNMQAVVELANMERTIQPLLDPQTSACNLRWILPAPYNKGM